LNPVESIIAIPMVLTSVGFAVWIAKKAKRIKSPYKDLPFLKPVQRFIIRFSPFGWGRIFFALHLFNPI
jgi:hypothetical protein